MRDKKIALLTMLIVLTTLAGLFFTLPVSAAMPVQTEARRMHQSYSIEIIVECLDTAIAAVRALPGFDVHSSSTHNEPHWGWSLQQAHFTRRVESWAFRHVQAVLRDLGEVSSEYEHARHLGGDLAWIETRLAVLSQEIDRLSGLMAASTTLNILIAVDNRMSSVVWERDHLIGRRNHLLNDANNALIHIILTEESEFLRPEPPTFGTRVADSFLDSARSILRGGGNFVVFVVRISLPLLIWCVIGSAGIFIIFRITKRLIKRYIKKEIIEEPIETVEEIAEETAKTAENGGDES
jgi:hypothetical protein